MEAASSDTGKEIHIPDAPRKRDRIYPAGTVMTSWRSREMSRDSPPRPRASNTPANTVPTVEIRKPREMILSAVSPSASSSASAWNSCRIHPGTARDRMVPSNMIAAGPRRQYRMV